MTGLKMNKDYAKYLESNFDITVDAAAFTPVSKAIQQTKVTEVFSALVANPNLIGQLDLPGAISRLLTVNDEKPDTWLKPSAKPAKEMMVLAEAENMIMSAGQPLAPTENATEDHTMVHLMFTQSAEFQQFPPEIQALFELHILGEHDNNPATGAAGDLLGPLAGAAPGAAPGVPGASSGPGQGQIAPLNPGSPQTGAPQSQVADLQPTNFAVPER